MSIILLVSLNFMLNISHGLFVLQQRLLRETRVWRLLSHPNILPLLGHCYDFDRPDIPCLVSPYYGHGIVTSYLKDRPDTDKLPLVSYIDNTKSAHNVPLSVSSAFPDCDCIIVPAWNIHHP